MVENYTNSIRISRQLEYAIHRRKAGDPLRPMGSSKNLSMNEGGCDSFARARRPVRQKGFLLHNCTISLCNRTIIWLILATAG